MGSFAPGRGATLAAGKWLAGSPSTSVPAGFPVARGIAMGALGGCPPRTVSGGNAGSPTATASMGAGFAAALAVCPFGWTPAATPNSGNAGFTASSTAGVFSGAYGPGAHGPGAHGPGAHGTCPSVARLADGDAPELMGAGSPSEIGRAHV